MPPSDVAETYFRKSMDLKCEEACYKESFESLKTAFNPIVETKAYDEKENCTTECFIPRKGTSDA